MLALLAGVGLGSLTWMTILTGGVSLARRWVGDRLLRAVDGLAGVGLLGFGGLLAYRTSATERLHRPQRRRSAASWPASPRRSSTPTGSPEASRFITRSRTGQAEAGRRRLASDAAMAYYVTTPIYYVNAAPHLGHAYTTIGADILARHMRQRGEEVFFLTGTDEHGEPVAQAAEREGVTPKELADRNAERFKALMPRINATNDFFIRTSDPRHKRARPGGHAAHPRQRPRLQGHLRGLVLPALRGLQDRERDRARTTRARSTRSRSTASSEENWFFRLSAFQEPLEQLYAEQPDFVRPRHRYNEALAFITGGLNDVRLSRAKLDAGASRSRGTPTTSSTSGSTRS